MQTDELLTVHHALNEAAQETDKSQPMGTYTFRIPDDVRAEADEICQRHGVRLGSFLRACADILRREYRP